MINLNKLCSIMLKNHQDDYKEKAEIKRHCRNVYEQGCYDKDSRRQEMTLDEAIAHLNESLSDETKKWSCEECKNEHKQLLKWLCELRDLKRNK